MAGTDRDAKSRAMTERDKIKQRIAKLLNLTTDKGASEAEAMQAAERAAELMAHYDIQASELQIKSARAVSKHALVRRYGNLRIAVPTARHIAARHAAHDQGSGLGRTRPSISGKHREPHSPAPAIGAC